jgi:hypothetical protein
MSWFFTLITPQRYYFFLFVLFFCDFYFFIHSESVRYRPSGFAKWRIQLHCHSDFHQQLSETPPLGFSRHPPFRKTAPLGAGICIYSPFSE